MLELYHGGSSVCSAKVRVGLAEKELDWASHPVNLQKGEQFDPAYLKVNAKAVVPTLIHDGFIIGESSIILEFVDALSSTNTLMPEDAHQQVTAKLWLLRCLDIHGAINTMTFSTVGRQNILANRTPEQIAAMIAKMPNPKAAAKRADLMAKGLDSDHVRSDFDVLHKTLSDMQSALEKGPWMNGDRYSIIDTAIISYIDRLDRLGMSGLWEDRFPRVGDWLEASRKRPSYEAGINAFIPAAAAEGMRNSGDAIWPEVKARWEKYLES